MNRKIMPLQRRRTVTGPAGLALAVSLAATALIAPTTASAATATVAADANPAPAVVPALKTWTGGSGALKLSSTTRIVAGPELADVAAQFAGDLDDVTGMAPDVVTSGARAGDIVLDLDAAVTNADGGERFTKEGYDLAIADRVEITAPSTTGVFYGTRSVLQILAGTDSRSTLPRGESADWPDYAVRGFTLDVGRRFFTADFVRDYISMMSWYKLNNFQIHLNDNQIARPSTGWQDGYAGFRLKSDNPAFAGLASDDGAYTRTDWKSFEDTAAAHQVQIIPEIDVPAHSLAFIKWKPELGLNGGDSDHLDLTKPATTEVIKSVFDEFAPWFEGPDLHYGADEYPRQYATQYRDFFNAMAEHVRGLGKQPRAWGSMTVMNGNADGYDRDVIINTWNDGWYGMKAAEADGYRYINTNDGTLYVVPFADYYHGSGLNNASLYASWQPNRLSSQDTVPAGGPEGAMFAVWNDLVDRDYTELDVHGLIRDSFPVIAQKTWTAKNPSRSYADFTSDVSRIGRGPDLGVIEQTGAAAPGELSFGVKANASSTDEGSDPAFLTDGRSLTRWTTSAKTADLRVDLGEAQSVGRLEVDWAGTAPASFRVATSVDGRFWQVADEATGGAGAVDLRGTKARYVALTGIESGGDAISAWALRVYGPTPLTAGATATSSGDEAAGTPAADAIDGNPATRWSASYVAQPWLAIDLGAKQNLDRIDILWEAAAASAYSVQVGDDGTTWRTVAERSGMPAATGKSRADSVSFDAVSARYVRVLVTGKNMSPYLSIIDVTIPRPAGATAEILATTTATSDADGVFGAAVPVHIAALGSDGPASGLEYRLDGGDWFAVPASGDVEVSGEGRRLLEYRAAVGKTQVSGYAELGVDTVGPVTRIDLSRSNGVATGKNPLTAVITAKDGFSAIGTVEMRVDGGAWATVAAGESVTVSTRPGPHFVEARSTDVHGNVGGTVSAGKR
ncbi:discoidin domain-containing protein [Microbacterium sp. NPDC057741]|uniref:discoidin domain-containing protein n=2 Tax=unclassified Microbacterium TaxID=2609290 RepID=UPI00366ADA03